MNNKWKLITSVGIPLVGGTIVGTLTSKSTKSTYKKLEKPSFSPPGIVFPVAWTSLYTMMGIAKYKFNQEPKSNSLQQGGNIAYSAQLGVNFLWSFLFFRFNLRGAALFDAVLLWLTIILNAYYFYQKNNLAGNLMVPYGLWATFAVILNYAIWRLND